MKKKLNIIDQISVKMMDKDYTDDDIISMIEELPDIDMPGRDGRTILIHAATYGRISVAEKAISKKADINSKDDMGYTPLHAAVISKNYEIAELLLSNQANINALDNFGNTPLFRASHQDIEMIKLLLRYGADPHQKNNFDVSPYMSFTAYPDIIKLFDANS